MGRQGLIKGRNDCSKEARGTPASAKGGDPGLAQERLDIDQRGKGPSRGGALEELRQMVRDLQMAKARRDGDEQLRD